MTEETRLAEIEAKLTLAEDLLETLNLTVHRQQSRIDMLEQHLLRMARQLVDAAPQESRGVEQERPPHY